MGGILPRRKFTLAMLPGFRFLFAAILVSISMLVFALGAAALLRTTHEQFANNPSWRTGPQEQMFAQASEPAEPVLAAFRAEPVATEPEPSLRDEIPTIALPVSNMEQAVALAPQAAAEAGAPETEARQSEPPTSALTPEDLAIAAATDSPAPAGPSAVAATTAPPATQAASEPPQSNTPSTPTFTGDATALAVPSDPTTSATEPPANAKAAGGAPKKATEKRAHRAKQNRPIVRRPPPPPLQQTYDPFFTQPAFPTTTTATRTR